MAPRSLLKAQQPLLVMLSRVNGLINCGASINLITGFFLLSRGAKLVALLNTKSCVIKKWLVSPSWAWQAQPLTVLFGGVACQNEAFGEINLGVSLQVPAACGLKCCKEEICSYTGRTSKKNYLYIIEQLSNFENILYLPCERLHCAQRSACFYPHRSRDARATFPRSTYLARPRDWLARSGNRRFHGCTAKVMENWL